MQKVRQNDLNFSENQFFVFDMLIYFFCKRFEQFWYSRTTGPIIQQAFLRRHLQFLIKVPQMTAKLSKKQNCRNSDANLNKNQLVWFWNTHNLTKNKIGVRCLLEVFPSEMA